MTDPQIEIAKEWLTKYYESAKAGRICAYTLKEYIQELEAENKRLKKICAKPWADSKRLDKLLNYLREMRMECEEKWTATAFQDGYISCLNDTLHWQKMEENNHE